MNELQPIQSKIYEIRGKRVMLDFDLAQMYEVETRRLKEQVKRNIERFPEDFMFQLSKNEWSELIANCDNLPENVKYSPALPFAFTQEGVAMLSGILRSPIAIKVNISIMRAFVAMREYITNTNLQSAEIRELRAKIEALEISGEETLRDVNDLSEDLRKDINNIYQAIAELSIKLPELDKPRRPIGYGVNHSKE